jgi:curved DNA-binding protein CbpA
VEIGRAYAVLGLGPGASTDEVRQAYRGALRRLHPDTGSGDVDALTRAGRAYRVIVAERPQRPARPEGLHVDVYA